ncbi:MAG TPA: glutamate 5-kinase [Chloroflexota bacterium]|nr:glutamate 5-kinase [Chloroflexota bacterium]
MEKRRLPLADGHDSAGRSISRSGTRAQVTGASEAGAGFDPRRIVVKLGSSLLARPDGLLDESFIRRIASGIAALRQDGRAVLLVSSGAVAAGRGLLPEVAARADIPGRQMLAAVGQPRLMRAYERAFARHGLVVAQALLTQGDVAGRAGYLSARSTLLALLERGVIPIVNENDVVADDELRFGDNDRLSAVVATLVDADVLLLLSDVAGLFDADPRQDPGARLIPLVMRFDPAIEALARPSSSGLGTGGMVTKLQAARLACVAGITTVIAAGRERDVLRRVVAGEPVGTRFMAGRRPRARRNWLHTRLGARGTVTVDDGAAAALQHGGRSLLPAGLRQVHGTFQRGDPIDVLRLDGTVLAHGLANYSSDDLSRLQGRRSSEIAGTLGYHYGDEAIHRNNLVLV